MNPRTSHHYTPLQKAPETDDDPNATPRENKAPNIIAETGLPLQLSYRAVSTIRSAILLSSIIIANCVCSGLLYSCLWHFSEINNLSKSQKRAFNTVSLLLSAALGFGIGFLCNEIGYLVRGTVLQSKPHSVEGVCACSLAVDSSSFFSSSGAHTNQLIMYLGWLDYERNTHIIRFIIAAPVLHSPGIFDYMGTFPLPLLLCVWPFRSCISRVRI